jgi:SAM-dependent methyltransferase
MMSCRHCGSPVRLPLVDLGTAPPSNAYLSPHQLEQPELHFPLRVAVCEQCWLVQTEDYASADKLFDAQYAYFSSTSSSWLRHASEFVETSIRRFGLGRDSLVAEVACNDGYLLQYVQRAGIPCYGIEPTASTAGAARALGLQVEEVFLGRSTGESLSAHHGGADLVVANNVLAHVPDINDFVQGVARLLKPEGVASFEFPHLVNLVDHCQFDTIYHEHYSYLSLSAVERIFQANGLRVIDVESLPTHGGSLRVFAARSDTHEHAAAPAVAQVRALEAAKGVTTRAYYAGFSARAEAGKRSLLRFLLDAQEQGRRVAAYGAAAKGNTFLNYAGVRGDLLAYVVDRSASKIGKFLPGSRIPVVSPDRLEEDPPESLIILPWNIKSEVATQLAHLRAGGTRFVTFEPLLRPVP